MESDAIDAVRASPHPTDYKIRAECINRIQEWVEKHSHRKKPIDENILQRHIDDVSKAFDTAVASLKG